MDAKKLSSYEEGQNYSFINRGLHARGYNVLEKAIGRLCNEEANKNRKLKILDLGCGAAKVFESLGIPRSIKDLIGVGWLKQSDAI